MELRPLCVMLLLTGLIHCSQTGALKATLTLQSGGTEVFRGENVTLKCEIEGEDEWTYIWFMNETEISTIKTSEYTFMVNDEAPFTCMGTQTVDGPQITEKSNPVRLSVSEKPKPTVSVNPQSSIYTGDTVTLSCNLQTTGWRFLWYTDPQKSNPLSPGARDTNTLNETLSNEGQINYSCKAQRGNYDSEFSDPVTITVSVRPKTEVNIQPAEHVFTGESVTLTCDLQTGGSWSYHWYRDNKQLRDAAGEKTYTIRNVETSHQGHYTCNGTQSSDPTYTQTSDAVTLTVSEKPKPTVSVNPQSSIYTGDTVTLSCNLQTTGWRFLWYTDPQKSNPLPPGARDTNTLNETLSNEGQINYSCKAQRGNYDSEFSDPVTIIVSVRPKTEVNIQPAEHVFTGESVTLTCDLQTGRSWSYHWYRDNKQLRDAAGEKTYTIRNVETSHQGLYTCNGTQSSDPTYTQTSDAVTLTVSEKPKPTVSVNPQSSIYTGDTVTLSCNLQSTGWRFLWYTDPQKSNPLSGARDTNTHNETLSNEGQINYSCKAQRGNYDSEFSDPVTIIVSVRPKPKVNIQPAGHVFIGESVTLTCDIRTGGSWWYHWYRDNKQLRDAAEKKTYTIHNVETSHQGLYTCKGTQSSDPTYTQTSDAVTLTVSEKPKPELRSDLKGAALTGNSVTLYCTLKLQSAGWKFYWSTPTQSSETETHDYTIRSVRVSDGGQYWCRAGRGNPVYYTDYSDALWVNVIERPKPVVIIKPDKEVFRGERVTFRCEIPRGRDTEWTYSWKRNDYTRSYRTTQEFSLYSVGNDVSGKYTCSGRRSDSQSSETSDAVTLTVSEKPKPTVSVNPQSSIYTGDTVTLSCNLQSTGWTFLWYNYQQSKDLTPDDPHSNTLTGTVSNEGQIKYACKAQRGNYDSEFSDPVRITVRARPKPVVTIQPAGRVFIGETVTFTCNIRTGGSWSYDWYRDNTKLSVPSWTNQNTIYQVKTSDKGGYTCKGTQSSDPTYPQTSDAVTLTVSEKPKPELTSDLKGAALTGNSVTLYCTLKLQSAGWKFYWITSTQSSETETDSHDYAIRSVRVSDGGQYKCRAGRGNPVYYTHYSDALWVEVIERPKPVVIIKPDKEVFRGETVTFRCEIQRGRDTEWTYSWKRNDYTRSYRTIQEFSLYSVENYHSGKYTCSGRRSDSQSSETSDAVTLTVSEKPKPELRSGLKGAALTGNSVTLSCTLKPQSAGWKFYWITPTQRSETESHDYTIRSVRVSDGGQYWCRAGRGNPVYYTHYSDALWVNVVERPKPVVSIKPDKEVFRGETVTFRCEIPRGRDTEWTYSWKRNDDTLSSRTTQEFSLDSVGNDVSGKYTCSGRRSDSQSSETSDAVTLTVSEKPKPELTSDLKGAALTGIPVTLYCTLKPQSAGWKFYWNTSTQSSETETESGHYVIRPVNVSDGGQYWCRAGRGNPVYYTHYSDALWVKVTGESAPVSLIISPSRTQHFTADSLSLSCEDQSDSTGWTVRRYTHKETPFNCLSYSGSTCNISSLSTSHTGVYWCQSESGGHSNPVNITVHHGDVILDSPVHPVTEGRPLTLRCLYRNTKISESGADFYKNDSVLQNQTTGEMTIRSVSKSDEGFYHCKHPQRGESPKSWVSVKVSAPRSTGLILGLSLAFVFAILMILLILLLRYKKKKGVEYQSQSSAVNQDTSQLADGENIYENAATRTTADSAAGSSNTVNPQVVTRKKKQNDHAARGPDDVMYSKIEMKKLKLRSENVSALRPSDVVYSPIKFANLKSKDAATNPGDVTYAEIEVKKQKKPKQKEGKSVEGADTVYSELKQNIDNGDFTETADTTYAQVRKKGKMDNPGGFTETADATYAQVRKKGKRDNPGS
ncbi:immunoglobulin superfamily member 1-like [Neoarius graeffei]|uniref:immunoglobulin superfamily member 1-like n=1 Tax=Neoarius graeffei TaxID=443677 RepID=UPI00298BC9B6|nr:immunoglobulin superfamily member 1-like [Neoarius graeffei]